MTTTVRRTLAAAGIGAALLGPVGCGTSTGTSTGGPADASPGATTTVHRDAVATSVASALQEKGVQTGPVSCPGDLRVEVGQTMRCEFSTEGQPVDAVVAITAVTDGRADYDVRTEPRPVAQALLGTKVGALIGKQIGGAVDSSTCSGDLPPTVGSSVDCTLSGGGETAVFTVTVTGITGGLVNFSVLPKR